MAQGPVSRPEEEEVEIADARLRSLAFSAPFDQARRKAN